MHPAQASDCPSSNHRARAALRLSACCLLALSLTPCARAQQLAPSQNSLANEKYREVDDAPDSKANPDEKTTSSVTLNWNAIPLATTYLVKIAHDPDMSSVFYTVNTSNTTYSTPELTPGAYYFVVEGYASERQVGKTTTKNFVVGKPVSLSGKRQRLPAPTIVGPKHMDLFPTYGNVRLSWQAVPGSRGYRFRLWNEDNVRENYRWKRETPPRWVTEVATPWIEVHDAPYSSYMYLESGVYRWDVAAIDKDGGYVGETAMGYFDVSHQWFLKPSEVYIRARYGLAPQENFTSTYPPNSFDKRFTSPSNRFDADLDWWIGRQWGLNLDAGMDTIHVQPDSGTTPTDSYTFGHYSASALYRNYLSTVPWGWALVFGAGLSLEEFPQVQNLNAGSNLVGGKFRELGFKLNARIIKHFHSRWELHLLTTADLHFSTTGAPVSVVSTGMPLSGEFESRIHYNWTYHFATTLGVGANYLRADYSPSTTGTPARSILGGYFFTLGVQFNYYPEPNYDQYYPDDGKSAYYPGEQKTFYKSERRGHSDDYYNNNGSQRWRPY